MKNRLLIAVLCIFMAAATLCACAIPGAEKTDAEIKTVFAYPKAPVEEEALAAWREENAISPEFDEALKDFSLSTASQLIANDENNCYSPLSLFMALSILTDGAEDETAEELFSALGVADAETLREQNAKLFRLLYRDSEEMKMLLANSLWIQNGFPVEEDFLRHAAENYYASIGNVDFERDIEGASKEIGAWISENTKGLLGDGYKVSDPSVVLSIINAVYFKDAWEEEFDTKDTKPRTFHNADGTETTTDFMYKCEYFDYGVGEGWRRLVLPMKNSQMLFVLPNKDEDLSEMLKDPALIQEMLFGGEEDRRETKLYLPKFKIKSSYNLIPTLQQLGVKRAFTEGVADLGGISKGRRLFVGTVKQEALIIVDEKGAEAAAYTAMEVIEESVPQYFTFCLDRPFLYAVIVEDQLIFVGTYSEVE
ncbi:MAG: serpin family protein [Christensenellaceae bacterium]|nr:serpin family protein [Christensenellaceae bacterium]